MEWKLVQKKEANSKKPFKCYDCEQDYPAGTYHKRYVFKKGDEYRTERICPECFKYYIRKDLKV